MTRSEVRAALGEAGVVPSKRLGQNFLCDRNTARWIVEQLDPGEEDCVVEVGPGTGALSEQLRGRVRKLILVEHDRRLAAWLERRFARDATVKVVGADGARYDVRGLFKEQPVKLLGNLPYSAGGAILRNFLTDPSPVNRAVIMLQKEVIDRIVAVPRTKSYGVLSLRMQRGWQSKPMKTIAPELFHPRPTIDSTVMVVEPRGEDLPVHDGRLFDELIRRGFAQRRKQLRKAMPPAPPWPEAAAAVGCSATARAEELSLEEWVALTRAYDEHAPEDRAQGDDELFDVVDERDEVVGQERRATVHDRNLLHRAVHVFLVNKRDEIFMQKRSRLKDVHPGRWDSSVSGHLDAGENYETAARREVFEEAGQTAGTLECVAKIPACEATGWEFVTFFKTASTGPVRFPCSEVEAGIWMAPREIAEWVRRRPDDFATGFLECWRIWDAHP